MFIAAIGFIGLSCCDAMKYVSISNQECNVRLTNVQLTIININCNELFNKCSGSGNGMNNTYSKL